jgi:hypothetical protein
MTTTSGGPFAGTATVNAAGVVSLNNVRPAGGYQAVMRATDHCGATTDASISFSVQCPTLTLSPATLPAGFKNIPYSQSLTATGGTARRTSCATRRRSPTVHRKGLIRWVRFTCGVI